MEQRDDIGITKKKYVDYYIKDDVLFCKYHDGAEITLDIAKKLVAERIAFQKGKSHPMIIDINGVKYSSKEARRYLSTEGAKGLTMGAFIVKTSLAKMTFNFFVYVDKPSTPTKFFTNEEDALKWIHEMNNAKI